jgi:hypothetical protein
MSEKLLEQVKSHRKGIKHESLSFSLAELVNMSENGSARIQAGMANL